MLDDLEKVTGCVVARVMKIHRKLTKSRKHNEKHMFHEVSAFLKMLIFEIFLENEEIFEFLRSEKIKKKVRRRKGQSTSPPSGNLVDGLPKRAEGANARPCAGP